jgi:hypothetical protein
VNPADDRVRELLDKWLASLELHLKYSSYDEAAYLKVQPWPAHDRPSRWIIEVAKAKARELRDQVESRVKMGDAKFSESLELMAFLVNLVGARVDRFIPLAEAATEVDVSTARQPVMPAATAAAPAPAPAPARAAVTSPVKTTEPDSGAQRALAASVEATREMPRPAIRPPPDENDTVETPRAKPDTRKVTRRETKTRADTRAHPDRASSSKEPSAKDVTATVIADAVRLTVWGRKWHELAELIARFADRPSVAEIRRILRDNRASIERTADKERSKKK